MWTGFYGISTNCWQLKWVTENIATYLSKILTSERKINIHFFQRGKNNDYGVYCKIVNHPHDL